MPSPEHVKPPVPAARADFRGNSVASRDILSTSVYPERNRQRRSDGTRVPIPESSTSTEQRAIPPRIQCFRETFRKQSHRVNGKTNRFARSPVKRNCSANLGRERIGGVAGMKSRRAFKEKKGGRIDFQDWCDDICLVYGRTYARVRTSEVRRSINRPLLKSHINALTRTPTHSQPLSLSSTTSPFSLSLSLSLFPSV